MVMQAKEEYVLGMMTKTFLGVASIWIVLTVLLGMLALSGCFVVPDGGGGHDDHHDDDHGPPQGNYDQHENQDPH
jgi:hypothetical protein